MDYYLRDGRSRIESRYRDLLRTRDLIEQADVGVRPAEISEGLRQLLEALNRDDPHFVYAFEVSHDRPSAEAERAREGLVMARTECAGDRGCVTIRVFARHRYALEERPITVSFGVEPESEAHLELQRALDFGGTAELPDGSVSNLSVSAPGGLGTSAERGGLRVSGYAEEDFVPFRLVFAVRGDDGQELARTSVAVIERRAGIRGKELMCVDAGRAFSLQIQITDPSTSDVPVTMSSWSLDFWTRPAVGVRDGVSVLDHLHKPNALVVSLEAGERHLMTLKIGEEESPLSRGISAFVTNLASIQAHTGTTLIVPETITAGDARRAQEAAQLLAGVLIDGTWRHAQLIVDRQVVDDLDARLNTDGPFAAPVPYTLRVGSQQVDLGHYLLRLWSPRIASIEEIGESTGGASAASEPCVRIELEPSYDPRFELVWLRVRGGVA